jgi:hypothetical protein
VRWLTEYQRGSIFGAILVGVAFAAALSVVPRPVNNPSDSQTSQQSNGASAQHQKDETWWEWTTADPIATYTLGLCFIAFIQAGLFVWQLGYMREGLADAAQASRAARDTAKAATESNQISRSFAAIDQRPWVSIKIAPDPNGDITVDQSGQVELGINVRFKNLGRTPALKLIWAAEIISDPDTINATQEAIFVANASYRKGGAGIAIFPSERLKFSATTAGKVPIGSFQSTLRPDPATPSELFVVGCIRYEFLVDGVGVTNFCFQLATATINGSRTYIKNMGPRVAGGNLELPRFNVGNSAT